MGLGARFSMRHRLATISEVLGRFSAAIAAAPKSGEAQKRRQTARYALWWLSLCLKYAVRSSAQRANNWAMFAAFLLGAAADLAGVRFVYAEGPAGTLAAALLAAGAAWFIVLIVRLVLAPFRIWKNGVWRDDVFVFNEPVRAYTTIWRPADNGRIIEFKCTEVPPNSLVQYRLHIDGPRERLWGTLNPSGTPWFDLSRTRLGGSGKVRTDSKQRFYLECYSMPATDDAIVHVMFLGWQITELLTQPRVRAAARREPGFVNMEFYELMREVYDDKPPLQGSRRMAEEFVGRRIDVQAQIIHMQGDASGVTVLFRYGAYDAECQFGPLWGRALEEYMPGDNIQVRGVIAPDQDRSKLALIDCEIPGKTP